MKLPVAAQSDERAYTAAGSTSKAAHPVVLGLRENLGQFALLVLINAFVGGMVGLERTVLPLIAEQEFGLASKSAILSFIVIFGLVKALTNLVAGQYSNLIGRRRLLIAGWLFGLPVPFMVIWAPSWSWVIAANLLLGINQGLCWSTTVIMKIDLVGPARRGLAMGLNEFAGYGAVALTALLSGYLAGAYGLRPAPFYLGVGYAAAGLILSIVFVRDTSAHARHEAHMQVSRSTDEPSFAKVFARTSWRDRNLFSCCQAGLVNNLNDAVAWGLFPLFFASAGLDVRRIGLLAAIYPAVWGVAQVATGALSDRWGRKKMIAWGMWIQAFGIWLVIGAPQVMSAPAWTLAYWVIGVVLLGLGTALVYPTLLAAIGDVVDPTWRAPAVGVYRLWRDLGYVVGALLCGVVADLFGISWAIGLVGFLTFASGVIVSLVAKEAGTASPRGRAPLLPVA